MKQQNEMSSSLALDEVLASVNGQLRSIAQRSLPRSMVHQDIADLEADDLAQEALIKLWQAMEKGEITHHRAYARRIVFNAAMDMLRRYKPLDQLSLDEYGELEQGQVLFAANETTDDPAALVEQQDAMARSLRMVVEDVLRLPPQQRRAMICELKKHMDDCSGLEKAFAERGIDLQSFSLPQEEQAYRSHRASLSIARKKLRAMCGIPSQSELQGHF